MITFKQFLYEAPTDLKKILERDCSPFLLLENGHGQLFRGIRKMSAAAREITNPANPEEHIQYYKKEVRTERLPADTQSEVHDALDKWFIEEFNVSARKGSMFCFGGEGAHNTKQYGDQYVVFPIGPMKFVWSPKVKDLYEHYGMSLWRYDYDRERDANKRREMMDTLMATLDYTDKNLPAAIHSGNEIMVECEAYYAFEAKYAEQLADLLNTKKSDLEKTSSTGRWRMEDPRRRNSDK